MSNHPKRGLPVTHCRPNLEISYRLRYTQISNQYVPAPESPPHTGVPNRILSAPLSAAAPSSPWGVQQGLTPILRPLGRGFQRRALPPALVLPSPGEGFQRERAAALALCARGGMGDGGVPHVSGGGLRGRGLYAKGPFPLPHSGSYPLREQKTYYNTIGSPIPSPYHSD